MINPKTHRSGIEIWQVGKNRCYPIPTAAPKNQIMRSVMDDDVVGVIGERADAVSNQQTEPPKT